MSNKSLFADFLMLLCWTSHFSHLNFPQKNESGSVLYVVSTTRRLHATQNYISSLNNNVTKVVIYYGLTLCLPDIDECTLQTHTCWNDSVCVNLPGGYDCVCTSGPGCSGDCPQEEGIRRNGEDWKPSFDRCAICSCKVQRRNIHIFYQYT